MKIKDVFAKKLKTVIENAEYDRKHITCSFITGINKKHGDNYSKKTQKTSNVASISIGLRFVFCSSFSCIGRLWITSVILFSLSPSQSGTLKKQI